METANIEAESMLGGKVMDESDAPFREDEYTRTLEDDIVLLNIVKRDGLELDPESRLYKLGRKVGKLGF